MSATPIIWTLTDGRSGMQAQAEGLAQCLAAMSGGAVVAGASYSSRLGKLLPPKLAATLGLYRLDISSACAPNIVIGCGMAAQAAVLAVEKKYRAYTVYIQRPSGSVPAFDAIVAPQHDYYNKTPPQNLICTLGAVGKINPSLLATRRPQARQRFGDAQCMIAVLIGGDNRAYRMETHLLIEQLKKIVALTNAKLLITLSRRSANTMMTDLQQHFGDTHYLWDGNGENPYIDILAAADGYCITADSVNMISEASASGRAVYLLPLVVKAGARAQRAQHKFNHFHQALRARGNIRLWEGEWEFFSAPALEETEHAAQQVWQRYLHTRNNCDEK
ncbi:MAG: mitochondrial fission ELM1 family protein [Proteobacteria bacterium]|nr:mitochondrial fission ELM1 family protein [Pseudomonadota bacterium]